MTSQCKPAKTRLSLSERRSTRRGRRLVTTGYYALVDSVFVETTSPTMESGIDAPFPPPPPPTPPFPFAAYALCVCGCCAKFDKFFQSEKFMWRLLQCFNNSFVIFTFYREINFCHSIFQLLPCVIHCCIPQVRLGFLFLKFKCHTIRPG